ncbi:hypothetical protein NSQ43_11340 [Sporosarcina sp. FSL W8-0480]|uniref:hypothetical protein n=1 Tax=Sporosarcina sp. FSL W8-0480 TaxID=2954701 RepID=UPI0030DB94D6
MTSSYKEIFDRSSIYLLTLLISPVLFGFLLAIYSAISFEDSWSIGPTVIVVAVYSFPFFAFGALPISLYIDFSARTKNYPNWLKVLVLGGFGTLAGLAAIGLFGIFNFMFFFGFFGAVIYFFVLKLLNKIIK